MHSCCWFDSNSLGGWREGIDYRQRRPAFALSRAAQQIKNVRTLQLIAGHSVIATTMKYIHPQQDNIADALASVDSEGRAEVLVEEGRCPTCGQMLADTSNGGGCKRSPQIHPHMVFE
jgi:hypothetical protein